jgi:hypothetical protein
MRARGLLLAALIVGSHDSRAALEFSAYLTTDSRIQFLITDLETGTRSHWLTMGDSFLGHTLIAFERERETLTLEQAGKSIVLRIKDSRIVDAGEDVSMKTEVKVAISNEGAFLLDGKTLNQLALIEHFEELVRRGKHVSLTIQAPLHTNNKNGESTRKVWNSFAVSGAKGSVSVVRPQSTK